MVTVSLRMNYSRSKALPRQSSRSLLQRRTIRRGVEQRLTFTSSVTWHPTFDLTHMRILFSSSITLLQLSSSNSPAFKLPCHQAEQSSIYAVDGAILIQIFYNLGILCIYLPIKASIPRCTVVKGTYKFRIWRVSCRHRRHNRRRSEDHTNCMIDILWTLLYERYCINHHPWCGIYGYAHEQANLCSIKEDPPKHYALRTGLWATLARRATATSTPKAIGLITHVLSSEIFLKRTYEGDWGDSKF